LAALGFNLVGYGCTTCIGNTGPLPAAVVSEIQENNLVAAAVLSGNRNFEGRVSPHTQANYLASPPLVVAYALAGTVDIDFASEPLGIGQDGQPVFLKQVWPSSAEILTAITRTIDPTIFTECYQDIFQGSSDWEELATGSSMLYQWDTDSTYLKQPPFFKGMTTHPKDHADILNARVLAYLGDSITTDHISPAGAIPLQSPAGKYLVRKGVDGKDFNSYGSRRGNDSVMVRGTFANIRLKNQIVPDMEGGFTRHFPSGERLTIFDAARQYKQEGTPLIILAGKEYGTGSSRDWAAKGSALLGVKAVLAISYERIHRSNLVGMGVLPLEFLPGENAAKFHLMGDEFFNISGIKDIKHPFTPLSINAISPDGTETSIPVIARLDTNTEVEYFHNGGILQTIIYQWLQADE
jgi:aconitate hydratase